MPLPLLAALAPVAGALIKKAATSLLSKPVVKVAAATAATLGVGAVAQAASQSNNLPMLPSGSGLPALPGMQTQMMQQAGAGGLPVPFWKGPGGSLQMPWNDPRIPQVLRQFALDDAYLRQSVRAPRGYVVVRDAQGRPYAVERAMAVKMKVWKPARKPPISAGDWNKYRTAQRVAKKLMKIAGPEVRKHQRKSSAAVCITRKRKAA
jgi:hypothetical protein